MLKSKILKSQISKNHILFSALLHIFIMIVMFFSYSYKDYKDKNVLSNNNIKVEITPYVNNNPQVKESQALELTLKKKKSEANNLQATKEKKQQDIKNDNLKSNAYIYEITQDSKIYKDISYKIKNNISPNYPLLAKKLILNEDVIIKTRILVDQGGAVQKIEFLPTHNTISTKLEEAFKYEVEKAIEKWDFSPVKVENKPVKVYFYKDFNFSKRI